MASRRLASWPEAWWPTTPKPLPCPVGSSLHPSASLQLSPAARGLPVGLVGLDGEEWAHKKETAAKLPPSAMTGLVRIPRAKADCPWLVWCLLQCFQGKRAWKLFNSGSTCASACLPFVQANLRGLQKQPFPPVGSWVLYHVKRWEGMVKERGRTLFQNHCALSVRVPKNGYADPGEVMTINDRRNS